VFACPTPNGFIAESDVQADPAFAPLTERYLRSCRYASLVTYYRLARRVYYRREELEALIARLRVPAACTSSGVAS
jgi:hypothetical protein